MTKNKTTGILLFLLLFFFVTGCATYYEKNVAFQQEFANGDLEKANQTLDKNKKAATDKDRLLFFLQKGVVLQILGKYKESNDFFEQAYYFTEDYRKSYTKEAASLLSNPMVKPYAGEDHELVLLHYFKTLNYLQLGQTDEALVECRRINDKLNLLNDRYENKKNRYKKDAFAMNLMGITYEVAGDVNNAFIAYRNAYQAYEEDYKKNFNTDTPLQLKKDLLRTAYLNGFTEELEKYEKTFSMKYVPQQLKGGELLFFWHNGLGPIKDEWSINFFIVKGQGGIVSFVNEELGLTFPFPLPSKEGAAGFGDLKFVRVAFPKYVERKPYYRSGELSLGSQNYTLELSENINDIAFKTLEDRMIRELGNSLLRLAVKQAAEKAVGNKSANLGVLLSAWDALSEKADTRNWQVLPYQISYARVPLVEGNNQLTFKTYSPQKSRDKTETFHFNGEKGKTLFHLYQSVESLPLQKEY